MTRLAHAGHDQPAGGCEDRSDRLVKIHVDAVGQERERGRLLADDGYANFSVATIGRYGG